MASPRRPGPTAQREASLKARAQREKRAASAIPSDPPPKVDAEYIERQMGRYDMSAITLGALLGVTPASVSQWLKGHPVPRQRQRELMDLFGEPLRLQEATLDELIREIVRRAMGAQ